jgi:glycerol-3-phosphate dehydrogenase (NAD(P)+)
MALEVDHGARMQGQRPVIRACASSVGLASIVRMDRIAVIGAGAWGTALAQMLARGGRRVALWSRGGDVAQMIATRRENAALLPGVTLVDGIAPTTDIAAATSGADIVILAVPTQHLRATMAVAAPHLGRDSCVVVAAKGIELDSHKLPGEVVGERLAGPAIAVLSGPSFAIEVARGLPAAVTIAAGDLALAQRLCVALGDANFRPYAGTDPVGAQIGGAIKNVVAIAAGIVVGRRLGDSARAALITRGLSEMTRLGVARGARRETFMGLSGLGDLVLTCGSSTSRNMRLGIALGEGSSLAQFLAGKRQIAEGVATAAAAAAMARVLRIDMPIVAAVDAVLHRRAAIDAAIHGLLTRPFRVEE